MLMNTQYIECKKVANMNILIIYTIYFLSMLFPLLHILYHRSSNYDMQYVVLIYNNCMLLMSSTISYTHLMS